MKKADAAKLNKGDRITTKRGYTYTVARVLPVWRGMVTTKEKNTRTPDGYEIVTEDGRYIGHNQLKGKAE